MFNKQIVWCGLTGYAVGVGYSLMIESLTRNKWDTYYKNHKYGLFMTPLKPGLLSYFVSISSIIGASAGMYIGYRLQ
tara:strand:+ start:130 stop:360 length:231 start_codon:yes stop_codon:yes gene_type:complete